VLDQEIPFLEGRPLNPDEHEAYERPTESQQRGSLYDHCLRAVALNLANGRHGLPLMGTGDWNDGMNLVGSGGQGESVWLGWFLLSILAPLADLASARGEHDRGEVFRRHADALTKALEEAWDGECTARAFRRWHPLGSAVNDECRIDADRTVVGSNQRAANPTGPGLPCNRSTRTRKPRRRHRAAADASVRAHDAEPRLSRLRPWRPRKRRAA
jgi:cyclic beta-1,2-glucan synthetase